FAFLVNSSVARSTMLGNVSIVFVTVCILSDRRSVAGAILFDGRLVFTGVLIDSSGFVCTVLENGSSAFAAVMIVVGVILRDLCSFVVRSRLLVNSSSVVTSVVAVLLNDSSFTVVTVLGKVSYVAFVTVSSAALGDVCGVVAAGLNAEFVARALEAFGYYIIVGAVLGNAEAVAAAALFEIVRTVTNSVAAAGLGNSCGLAGAGLGDVHFVAVSERALCEQS